LKDTPRGERGYDIFSRLLKDRNHLSPPRPSTMKSLHWSLRQFLFLEKEDPDRDIDFYINSPGGSVTAGKAIYDTMQVSSRMWPLSVWVSRLRRQLFC